MNASAKYLALLPAIGLMLLPRAVEADTHVVKMSRYNHWFDGAHFFPPRLTIPVGDRVEWRSGGSNGGYGEEHNITSSGGQFPSSPTSISFTHFHTFDRPGEFRYSCTVHGKSGVITVAADTTPSGINAGLNDAWWDPATPGQGFFINVFPDSGQVFLAWFTYDTERPADTTTANIGEPGHRWLTAFGPYAGNQAVLDIEITQGGAFNAGDPATTQHQDGTVILEFNNCYTGTVTYDVPSIGRQGVIPVRRVSNDNARACEAIAGVTSTGSTGAIESASRLANSGGNTLATTGSLINRGLNDSWMNPATPGQGFFINVFPIRGTMFLAWFTFDTPRPPGSVHANLGDPGHRWLTAYGPYTGDQAVLEIELTEGGTFDAPSPVSRNQDGTLTVDMTDCENGTVAYDIVSANLQGEIPIKRIARDNVPLCKSIAEQLQQSR